MDVSVGSADRGDEGRASARTGPRRLEPWTRLGRYLLLHALGAGGMGTVYAAYDSELARRIAIKMLRPDADTAAARARLLREAQAMARLTHANVVAVYDVGTAFDGVFIAME